MPSPALSPLSQLHIREHFLPTRSSVSSLLPNNGSSPHHVTTRPFNRHFMITMSKTGSLLPRVFFSVCQTSSDTISSVEPKSVKDVMMDSNWLNAMNDKFQALQNNNTWTLVPVYSDMNVVGSKWVFRTKFKPDGSILKHKARLVVKGFHQTDGLDTFDTFNPVMKSSTISVLFALAVHFSWDIQQVDMNNAFLNGDLKDEAA
ncbi:hypothetical protein LWI28_029285 [Acer negundo]|uniref:Reverse transcriptase Ty1/copia-type domain-containing protein n=1 Tax=Acer negundo TaxID=4023 RepID=A0AAD5P3K0_ACENE|nr:hypothetical protein LWI28_029285 [Acer negundo]